MKLIKAWRITWDIGDTYTYEAISIKKPNTINPGVKIQRIFVLH